MGKLRIDSRYLLKARYQRNFAIGTLTSVVLAVITAIVLWPSEDAADGTVYPGKFGTGGSRGPGAWGVRALPANAPQAGFLGFVRLVAIPDGVPSVPVPSLTGLPSPRTVNELGPVAIGEVAWEGSGAGTGTGNGRGDGIGDGDDYGLPPRPPLPLILRDWDVPAPPSLAERPRPALAEMYPPRFPPEADESDTGVVTIRLTIYADATIDWAVLDETPMGVGFAREAVQALMRSRFTPYRLRGEPVTMTVTYRCTICMNCRTAVSSDTDALRARTRHATY